MLLSFAYFAFGGHPAAARRALPPERARQRHRAIVLRHQLAVLRRRGERPKFISAAFAPAFPDARITVEQRLADGGMLQQLRAITERRLP